MARINLSNALRRQMQRKKDYFSPRQKYGADPEAGYFRMGGGLDEELYQKENLVSLLSQPEQLNRFNNPDMQKELLQRGSEIKAMEQKENIASSPSVLPYMKSNIGNMPYSNALRAMLMSRNNNPSFDEYGGARTRETKRNTYSPTKKTLGFDTSKYAQSQQPTIQQQQPPQEYLDKELELIQDLIKQGHDENEILAEAKKARRANGF